LREEYFDLLPESRRVLDELEAEVKHGLVPLSLRLDKYERLVVKSRVKECESALDSLRRRQEGATFDSERPELYSRASLNDLAGVRVLAFPHNRWVDADRKLRERFPSWTADPVPGYDENDESRALKYFGYCGASNRVRAEFKAVSKA
jgi:ppGpp synthetase/RelA/SpoT-type nucleotidyltranferase